MNRKPEIQYIGQFYVYGSEAAQVAVKDNQKKAKTSLPLPKLEKLQTIYLDPVAVGGIVIAAIMLFTMVFGFLGIQDAWEEYDIAYGYLSRLSAENAELQETYRGMYDLADIEAKALAMGMVPVSELEVMNISVTVPEPEPEKSVLEELWEDFLWHLDCLFA